MRFLILFVLVIAFIAKANAKIIFQFESVVRVQTGAQATVPVYVTGTESEPLEAYDLPIDIGGDGRGFPSGLSFSGEDIHTDDYAQEVNTFGSIVISGTEDLPPGPPFDPQFEAVFSDDGPTIALNQTRRHLFNLLLDVPSDFVGSTPIVFGTGGFPNALNVTSGTQSFDAPVPDVLEFQGGTITMIPEPRFVGITAFCIGAVAFPRRRR